MSSIPTNAAAVADADVAALFSSPSSQQQQSQQQQQQQQEGESSRMLHAEDRYRYDRFHSASVYCDVDEYYSQRLNNTAVVNINAGRYDTAIVSLYRALQLSKSALQQRQQNPCRRRATVPSSSSSSSSPIRCMCGSCTLDACIFHSENTPSIMNSNNNNSNDDDNGVDESTMVMPNNTRLSSSASSSALDSSISMANNNNSYTISNNDNDNDNSNNNNSNRNRRNKKKRDISNAISPSDSNSTRDTDDDDDDDESNNTMNTKKKRKTTNNNTGSDTAEERCHQRQQQYRQQQQSSSAISSNNSFSSTYCIYQQPIHIPHVGHAMGSTLFFIVSFNLALASQLKYIAWSTSSVSTTSITKTIALYELILKWHTTTNNSTPEDDVRSDWDGNTNHNVITNNISNASIRFEMMIYNNLSEIYRMYSDRHNRSNHRIGGLGGGNDDRYCGNTNTDVNNTNTKKKKKKKTHSDEKSNMYLERLLSRVMMIVEYKTRHPTHQTTDRQQQPQQQQLQWNSNGTTTTTTTYFDYGIRSNHTTTNNATTTTTTTPLSLIPSFGYYYYNVNIDRFLQNLCTNGRALMLHHQEEPDNKNNHDHTSNTNDVQRYANAA